MADRHADHAMELDEAVIVAGFGCRKDAGVAEVLAAYRAALAACGVAAADALATSADKARERGLRDAAAALGRPLWGITRRALEAAAPHAVTRSDASLAATGLPSLAETAALGGCGPGARLYAPRLVCGRVTCALAHLEATA